MANYSDELYNSPVETALRVLCVLHAFQRRMSREHIRACELFAVYGHEIGCGKNLQNRAPGGLRAYTFRGAYVDDALSLLVAAGVAEGTAQDGYALVTYDMCHEDSLAGSLGGEYVEDIFRVCEAMAANEKDVGIEEFHRKLKLLIQADLSIEFGGPPDPIKTDWYVRGLEFDFWRMDGLRSMAWALAEHVRGRPQVESPRLNATWLEGLAEAARLEMKRTHSEERKLVAFRESEGYADSREEAL